MEIKFRLDVDVLDVAADVPFTIVPNPDFPGEAHPLCILRNTGAPPALARFIQTSPPGPLPKDPWEIEFHWATAGAAVPGFWIVDAWLASATFGGNLHVPSALVLPQAVPPAGNQRYAHIVLVPAGAVPLPPFVPPGEFLTARLYRLYTVLRFVDTANLVRVACRGEGPLIEFFLRE